ncbi:winged helix-turn-helix domain-containing protein [Luteimonas sp. RC10]|uniref:winged helix-turn-helix domain-containing protein n=1 Tax=Luteimonas sp. RC10 TaxID=2587035 RepID=UPI00160E368C|nr:DNA-binding winged helix-turn-helix (wHTH) protein/tetratricopeptide (TPR) repeat protein [Luteimonas sp. RC10]
MSESAAASPAHYRLDDLRIDVARQRVERDDGQVLDVAGLSFRLLHYLLMQGTRVVGFDELIAQVWAPALVGEDTVTQRVRLLRQALGDDGRRARYLRSVRGCGYQLCSPPRPDDDALRVSHVRGRALVAAAVLALLPVIAAIGWWSWPRPAAQALSPLLQRADYYASIGQRENNARALALYRQRLQEAPADVQAVLGLARAHAARLCLYGGDLADADRAQALAEHVLARQPHLAAAHAALGYAHDCRGEVATALAGYERAVALDPDADAARASAAYLYARQGRLADALAANLAVHRPEDARFLALQIAADLDLLGYADAAEGRYRRSFQLYPDNVFSNLAWPSFLYRHGRGAQAQAALDEALTRGTDHAGLQLLAAELALQRGDLDVARHAAQRARALKPHASLPATVAWIVGAEPRPAAPALRARIAALRTGLARGGDPLDGLDAALLASLAGDRAAALDALDGAVTAGHRDADYLRVSPLFADLCGEPGFAAVLSRIDASIARDRARVQAAGHLPADAVAVTAAR